MDIKGTVASDEFADTNIGVSSPVDDYDSMSQKHLTTRPKREIQE